MVYNVRLVTMFILALANPGSFSQALAQDQPPPAVVVERIKVQDVSNPAHFTARIEAIEAVDIRARVQGFLRAVGFKDGQAVKKGDTLFEIEPDQLQAIVMSAEAQVSRAEATQKSAERTLARTKELFGRSTISQANLDDAQAAFDIATADVKVAKAALQTAELNLSYAHIVAPIDGEIGRRALTVGNLVGPESGSLARIVSLDPIRVAFSLTEGLLVTLRQQESKGAELDPDTVETRRCRLANGTEYDQPGRIEYHRKRGRSSDRNRHCARNLPQSASRPDPRPVRHLLAREKDAPVIAGGAPDGGSAGSGGAFRLSAWQGQQGFAAAHHTGARVGNGWAVTEGLDGDEQVVVQGIQRLADGMTVQPSEGQPVGGG